ncbi:MAG: putative RDD family membrane protein YckC [Rickettsiales bacterium]|jgi:uncharacterized RDD family membrane protein YckC
MKFFEKIINSFGDPKIPNIYAGFWVRFQAALIDMVVSAPIAWAIIHISGVDLSQLPTFEQAMSNMLAGIEVPKTMEEKIVDFISYVVSISYSVYFLTSKKQATPGKRIMNIYVATTDRKRLSVNKSFARFLATILSGLLFGIGLLLIAHTKEKTALHDIICGTRVFYGKK